MFLFDQMDWVDKAPKGYSEPLFCYWNRSARPEIDALRQMVEMWVLGVPEPAKRTLRSDFRSKIDSQHQAAFFELYLHELLTGMGFDCEPHPAVPGAGTHPDFAVSRQGKRYFYLEATLARNSDDATAEGARIAQVYDTLNGMPPSDFFLWLRLRGAPETPPGGSRLRQDLHKWLSTLDADDLTTKLERDGLADLPTFEWSHDGWELSFVPIPKSAALRGKPGVRPIGIIAPEEFRILNGQPALYAALASKATKYGLLDLPFIVAVNVLDNFAEERDVFDALLGEPCIVSTRYGDGTTETRVERKRNGAWFGPKGPQNTRVSAVLVAQNLNRWNVATNTPTLFHNPWATRPLSPSHWPLSQWTLNPETTCLEFHPGQEAKHFLRIPNA
jgi:hypothetical protein